MLVSKKILCGACSLLFIAAPVLHSKGYAADNGNAKKTPWTMSIPASPNQWQAESTRARIVIFRLQRQNDNYAQLPLNVFVNKEYHASLYPEHQAIGLSLCPGKSSLAVALGSSQQGIAGYQQAPEVVTPELQAGSTRFYQIAIDNAGRTVGRWVDSDQAKAVLADVNIQSHTVSRVYEGDKCPDGVYTLNASALFQLAKYDPQGLLPGEAENLQSLAAKIRAGYKTIGKIVVTGHADPTGDAQSNQRLSGQRASTVVAQLIAAGLPSSSISVRSLGSSSPLVTDCDKYHYRSEIVACNQPNRRVEIAVYGVRQNRDS